MSKIEKLFYIFAEIVYIACVTLAAMHFGRIGILWWYVLVLFLRAYRGH